MTATAPRRLANRRSHGIGRASNGATGTSLVHGGAHVPIVTEYEATERFSATVTPFSAKQLAKITQRSLEAAKAWKKGRSCPNVATLITMARAIPAVRAWLCNEIGEASDFDSARVAHEVVKLLQQQQRGND